MRTFDTRVEHRSHQYSGCQRAQATPDKREDPYFRSGKQGGAQCADHHEFAKFRPIQVRQLAVLRRGAAPRPEYPPGRINIRDTADHRSRRSGTRRFHAVEPSQHRGQSHYGRLCRNQAPKRECRPGSLLSQSHEPCSEMRSSLPRQCSPPIRTNRPRVGCSAARAGEYKSRRMRGSMTFRTRRRAGVAPSAIRIRTAAGALASSADSRQQAVQLLETVVADDQLAAAAAVLDLNIGAKPL